MKLTLHEVGRSILNGFLGRGPVYVYEVWGLPLREHAKIAFFKDCWQILRWNENGHGNWTGRFATPKEALAALRERIFVSPRCSRRFGCRNRHGKNLRPRVTTF
jgi:hypothetical protein